MAHLLYRLNGDYNPLHATHVKAAVVQPTPIMHGLYGWNVASHAITSTFGEDLTFFRASFASPVRPSDILSIQMWKCGERSGCVEIRFTVKVGQKVVLSNGVALIRKAVTETKL
jgi:acyl dehydratase